MEWAIDTGRLGRSAERADPREAREQGYIRTLDRSIAALFGEISSSCALATAVAANTPNTTNTLCRSGTITHRRSIR